MISNPIKKSFYLRTNRSSKHRSIKHIRLKSLVFIIQYSQQINTQNSIYHCLLNLIFPKEKQKFPLAISISTNKKLNFIIVLTVAIMKTIKIVSIKFYVKNAFKMEIIKDIDIKSS